MKLYLLSAQPRPLLSILNRSDDQVEVGKHDAPVTPDMLAGFDLGISFGYRRILRAECLDACPFVNLHVSYLPWNRGADPNLWSWIDDTPKGVTIHWIDAGVDTGDIIAQRLVEMSQHETLASSYMKLQDAIVDLFSEWWPRIRTGEAPRTSQPSGGSYHRKKESEPIWASLPRGYETAVQELKDCRP